MSGRAVIGLFLVLTAGSVLFLFVQTSHDERGGDALELGTRSAVAACASGKRCLPDVSWLDTRGLTHTRAALAGKIVVVNFWATWCKPCAREIPDFARIATRYGDQVVVLGVMMDRPGPDAGELLNFMSDHDMTYPVIPVTQEIERAFQYPSNYPTTYVFDRHGNERAWKIRPMSEAELSGVIEGIFRD